MSEVSCRAFAMLLPALEAAGVSPEKVLEGSGHSPSYVRKPRNRVPWDDFAAILDRAGELLGSDEALVNLGGEIARRPAHDRLFGLAGMVASPRQLYWLMCRLLSNAVFGIVDSELVLSTRDRVRVTMRIPAPYRDCRSFFCISQGSIAEMPRTLDYPRADVAVEIADRYACFDVTIHPRKPGRLLRDLPGRLLCSPARLSEELAERQDELSHAIGQLRTANLRIGEQKLALERQVVELNQLRAEAERAAIEQRELDRKVQQTQRLESLGVLAGGVAHDFNNLLMIISAHGRLARREVGDNPAVQEHFEQVAAAVQQGSQLTSQMLAYAGHRMIEPGRVQLNDVLGELDRLLAATLRPNVRLDVNLPHDLPPVVADPAQLQQVCMNLINNAAEAMGDTAGTIEVRATVEVRDTESSGVGDARLEPGRYLRLTVRDTGPGMDPEAQARVFEPFYSTKGPGRGLGLAAVLGIVRAHGGAIEVQSAAGEGTRVAVLLPLGRQEQAEAARRQAGPRESRGAPPRGVLIVDGEPQLLRAAAELLRPHELAVQTAQDGKSALEAIEKDPAAVEVVVLDLTMPGMRSDEVYQEIRARWPRIRVVFSSGYDARDSSKRLGPDVGQRYLQKPYTEQALVEAVSGRKV